MRFLRSKKRILVVPLLLAFVVAAGTASVALAVCGPFSDVGSLICPFVLSMYFLGITAGTTSTTYSPGSAVTRGQMAIFMGALYNQVKRTENPYRVATGMNVQGQNFNYGDQFQTANTSNPQGFATDGFYDYVGNGGNAKIDFYFNGIGHSYAGTLTQTNNAGPMVCDGNYLFIGDYLGANLSRYQIRSASFTDPWVSGLSGFPNDVQIAEDQLIVPTTNGLDVVGINSGAITGTETSTGQTTAAAYVGDGTFWAAGSNGTLYHMDFFTNVLGSVPLDGAPTAWQVAFDGQNVWVPLGDGSIDVVATKGAQGGTIVDRVFTIGTSVGGIVFTGQWIVAGAIGDFGCGSTSTAFEVFDAATHAYHSNLGQCGSGVFNRIGFDGHHFWGIGSGNNLIYVQ